MCTFSFPPTSRRTVAANLVWVFNTCGGCFSMMKVLRGQEEDMNDGTKQNGADKLHAIKPARDCGHRNVKSCHSLEGKSF